MYVFLVTLLLYTTLVKSDSDTKYIDLLPEKEKEEFLEKIARRILEEVEIKSVKDEKSVEVSDSQLEKQNYFVHKILQEEKENLRTNSYNTYSLGSKTNTNFSSPALREDEKKLQQYVDLTLRTESDRNRSKRDSKRRVFTGFATDEKSNKDDKDSKSGESELDVQVRNFQQKSVDKDGEISLTKVSEKLTTDKIIAKLQNQSDENNTTDIMRRMFEKNKTHTEITTEKIHENKTLPTVDLETSDTYQTTLSNDNRIEIKTSTTDITNNFFATEVTPSESIPYEVIQETLPALENTSFDERKADIEQKSGGLRAYMQYDLEETVILRNSNTTKNVNVTETGQNTYRNSTQSLNKTNVESNDHANDSKVINIDVITIAPVETSIYYVNNNTENDFFEHTSPKIHVLTTVSHNLDSNLNETSDIRTISSNSLSKNVNDSTENVTDDSKVKQIFVASTENSTKLLLNGELKSPKENLLNRVKKEEKSNKKPIQEYKVYEIAPEATPFVKRDIHNEKRASQNSETLPKTNKPQTTLNQLTKESINTEPEETIQEEPYHVPIYNYQPKNAFYNPSDVFGRNSNKYVEDDEEKSRYDDDGDDKESSININNNYQPMPVPIYVYAPQNAFYDPNNNLGPNKKDQSMIENNDSDLDPEYSEYEEEEEKSKKEREQTEYQHYNDPHKENTGNVKVLNIKNNEMNTLSNLKKILENLVLQAKIKSGSKVKNTPSKMADDILSKDLDWDSKKPKTLLRCLYKNKCGQGQDSDEKDTSKEVDEIVDIDVGLDSALSKARQMMLLSGHYVLDSEKTDFSRLDEFFESAERVEKEEKIKGKSKSRNKKAQKILRTLLENTELHSQKPQENQKLDIAMDYYFDRPKRKRERNQKNIETPKIALILDKNKDLTEKEIKALRDKLEPKRKPEKHYEYLLTEESAHEITDDNIEELYRQLEKIDKLNLTTNDSKDLDVYVEVLGDMVKENDKGLHKYDWLGTAVDLQSAIKKMIYMIEQVQNDEEIHPSDLELLKYLVWLYSFAKEELSPNSEPNELRGIKIATGKKNRGKILTESGLQHRGWMNRIRPKPIPDEKLVRFQEFVGLLQNCLHDLHTALKYIAMVTKYKQKKWFENLKQIHVEDSRRRILELLIHLSSTRLFSMIEESSKNGLEDNFKKYLMAHEREIEKTKEEFVFVLSLIEEWKRVE